MNKEIYNQIIDEAYENYKKEIIRQREIQKEEVNRLRSQGKRVRVILIELLSKEEFINKCKTDSEFSEKWGLKIEERELSEKERIIFAGYDYENGGGIGWNMIRETVDMDNSIPRKDEEIKIKNDLIQKYLDKGYSQEQAETTAMRIMYIPGFSGPTFNNEK